MAIGEQATPQTRGWTLGACPRCSDSSGFPAHAGMNHRARRSASDSAELPRACGDRPVAFPAMIHGSAASPARSGIDRGLH